MIEKIITIILLSFISLIPILIWGYVFSYIDNTKFNKTRFFVWIFWWGISVIPILYLDKIIENSSFSILNIFHYISKLNSFENLINFVISLSLFTFLIAWIAFIFVSWLNRSKETLYLYLKNILIFIAFIIVLSFIILFFSKLNLWNSKVIETLSFWNTIFDSIKLIFFYYVIVAFIEETSKHFNFIQTSSSKIKTIDKWVLYAIFVALWFSLVENILYIYNLYLNFWLNLELAKIYFFRSVFSVMVHVLCSSVIAYFFSKAFIYFAKKELSINFIKTFFVWLFSWIFLHMIFDVSLTFGFSFIIIIYFIGWYFYISSIFYRD